MALEQLGPYRITRLLGRGGMGAVYEGVHATSGERAAVKILSVAFADEPSFRARFSSEIDTLKTLRHPNIVRLIGYGEQDGVLFYSMELVAGRNLHEELQSGRRFTWREVADLGIQVASALKHAHDHGVIHRDLKPANLLTTLEGTIKLTDFGIAKLFGATNLTLAGGVIGTVDFMSPEQAEGESVTTRSDLYSLGGVMYALLVGHPPFRGRTPSDVLHHLRTSSPAPIRGRVPEVPKELEDIVLQLLEREPRDRIATPLVLSKRLRAMLHGLAAERDPRIAAASIDAESNENAPGGEEPENDDKTGSGNDPCPTPRGKNATLPGSGVEVTREISPSKLHEIPWEDETIGTGPAVGPLARPLNPPVESAATSRTVAQAHFTAVDEDRAPHRPNHPTHTPLLPESPWARIASLAGLVLLLASLAYAAWYATRPLSADVLYARIQEGVAAAQGIDLLAVRDDIDAFLDHHDEDPRSEEIRQFRRDHDSYRLWRRLERDARKVGGAEYLPDVERKFVTAMREEGVNLAKSIEYYQDLLSIDKQPLSDLERECIAAAGHRAARLRQRLAADDVGNPIPPNDQQESKS